MCRRISFDTTVDSFVGRYNALRERVAAVTAALGDETVTADAADKDGDGDARPAVVPLLRFHPRVPECTMVRVHLAAPRAAVETAMRRVEAGGWRVVRRVRKEVICRGSNDTRDSRRVESVCEWNMHVDGDATPSVADVVAEWTTLLTELRAVLAESTVKL
jgi:hypothetical protein